MTSFEVAERAGVSQSTVSRALSGATSITDRTRAKVEAAARELGYKVDERAARLRSGKTGTIAIVVITRAGEDATEINPFHYNLLGSVCAAASARGYQALVSFQAEPEQYYIDYVESRQADGVIVIGTSTNDAAWQFHHAALTEDRIASWGSPFTDHPRVESDNRHGAHLAVERLLAGGYRDIAFIGDTRQSQPQFRERYDGYCQAMRKAGLPPRSPVFIPAATRAQQGHLAIQALLGSGEVFDAIFSACDAMAFGALEALNDAGFSVPDEVGVIGFDGLGSGAYTHPPLTTLEPDFKRAGIMLVEAALGEAGAEPTRVPVRLVERASVR